MKIVNRKINELIKADYNPRKISDKDFEQLKKSLETFECVEPIVVNKHHDRDDIIVGGHQRLKAMESLGWKEVPTIEVNLNLEQEKELNVRLNKNTGEFDFELLAEHFEENNLIDFGFEPYDFELIDSDEPDYSSLDDEDLSNELNDLTNGVKKAIQIEFDLEHYDEASNLVKFWRDRDAYIGSMIIEKLKEEKQKL